MSYRDLYVLRAVARRALGGPPPRLSPALTPGQRCRAAAPLLSTPGMGDRLGVKVPWRKRWCSLRAGGEVGRKPEANPAPGNTNRVEGGAIWVSLLKKAKPVTIDEITT